MANYGSRKGFADRLALPLMVLAFLVVGGFLYWLSVTAEPTEVVIVEEDTTRESGASAILDVEDFLSDPGQYQGRIVEVLGARVASRLGPQAFWIGPDDNPFLVKMGSDLLEAGSNVLVEQRVDLIGTVWMMSDSTLVVWDSLGAFPNQGDRIVAEFAVGSPFLEIMEVRSQAPGGGGDGGSTGDVGSN